MPECCLASVRFPCHPSTAPNPAPTVSFLVSPFVVSYSAPRRGWELWNAHRTTFCRPTRWSSRRGVRRSHTSGSRCSCCHRAPARCGPRFACHSVRVYLLRRVGVPVASSDRPRSRVDSTNFDDGTRPILGGGVFRTIVLQYIDGGYVGCIPVQQYTGYRQNRLFRPATCSVVLSCHCFQSAAACCMHHIHASDMCRFIVGVIGVSAGLSLGSSE